MAMTPSTMKPLGFRAPAFTLRDVVTGENKTLAELKSQTGTVIIFMCNHCPFVRHILDKLVEVAKTYGEKGISFAGINSNDVRNYPDDSPEKMRELAIAKGFSFPYLFDETQEIARTYDAACTPDFFVFDGHLNCVYRGRFDAVRPGQETPVTGRDLKDALDALLSGKPVSADQKPSLGCNIKWKES